MNPLRIPQPLLPALLILVGTACKTPGAASLKHTISEPTSQNGGFDYLDMDFEEYTQRTVGPFLPEAHAITIYAQNWMDHIDHTIRAQFPEEYASIPKPRIAIRKVKQAAAFTMGGRQICYQVPIRISPNVPINDITTMEGISIADGIISPMPYPQCQTIPVSKDRKQEFAQWYNKRFAPCQLAFDPAATDVNQLTMVGPCREKDFYPEKALSKNLVASAAPNRIVVFAGAFLTLKTEDEFLATLAHELAHYYRAHVVHTQKYNYCYQLEEQNHGHRPAPDARLDDLCDKLNPRIGFDPVEAAERKLGYYTVEQEADELALEFLAYIGVPPTAAADAWLHLAQATSGDDKPHEIPIEPCITLRQRGWKNEQGEPVFIPIGDYRNPHHSWCYRIRNIDRELEAHQYQIRSRTKPSGDWIKIQDEVRSILGR